MKRKIGLWQFVGFAAVSLLGTLLHFLYDLAENRFTALFSGVNESTWEHMKLLFFPMFLFAVIAYFFVGTEYENYWCIKLRGAVLGLLMIPVMFYTLRGIFGTTPDWINILIFFVSAAVGFVYETRQFYKNTLMCRSPSGAFLGFCIIAVLFFIFTFMPPEIPLFRDPLDGSFGL